MNYNRLVFGFLLVCLGLFFVLNVSFFDTKSITLNTDFIFNTTQTGTYSLTKDITLAPYKKGEIKVEKLNAIDAIYSEGDYTIQNGKIHLGSGTYVFDLNILSQNYVVEGPGFFIQVDAPGKFFIQIQSNGQTQVVSLDSLIQLQLLSENKKMTSMYLYPHMSTFIAPNRNKFLKNADLFRLENLLSINYFPENIVNKDGSFNEKFFSSNLTGISPNFLSIFRYIYDEKVFQKYSKKNIKFIGAPEINGNSWIQDYQALFYNENKKKLYYTAQLITQLNLLFQSQDNISGLISEVEKYSQNLNEMGYNKEVESLLLYYYINFLKVNEIDYIENIEAISRVLFVNKKINSSSFYIHKIYYLSDNNSISQQGVFQKMLSYISVYSKENHLQIDKNYKISKGNDIASTQHLSFYLKNFLLQSQKSIQTDTIENALSVLQFYLSLNNFIVENNKVNSLKETYLIAQNQVILEFLKTIRLVYFKPELLNGVLLDLDKSKIISQKFLSYLDAVHGFYFEFFNQNKNAFSEKNRIYINKYNQGVEVYKQLYFALSSYDEYIVKNDVTKSTLLGVNAIDNEPKNEYTVTSVQEYFKSFNGVSVQNLKVQSGENREFTISGLQINGDVYDFTFSPLQNLRIDTIKKNGTLSSLSYELADIELQWKDKYDAANDDEKYKYDFKNFFLNVFYPQNVSNPLVSLPMVSNQNEKDENKVILIFKRDKLFGDKGDFSLLKGYLDIKYSDVSVVEKNNAYDISIQKSQLQARVTTPLGDGLDFLADWSSGYNFSQTQRAFQKIRIILYSRESFGENQKTPLFGGNEIVLEENINLVDTKRRMDQILGNIASLTALYDVIQQSLGVNQMTITYTKNDNLNISFSYKNKKVNIVAKSGKILKFGVGENNFLNNKIIDYTEVTQYFNLIK